MSQIYIYRERERGREREREKEGERLKSNILAQEKCGNWINYLSQKKRKEKKEKWSGHDLSLVKAQKPDFGRTSTLISPPNIFHSTQ